MDQLFLTRRNLSSNNLSFTVCSLQMVGLQSALSRKRKERRRTEIEKNDIVNKLQKLKSQEQIAVNEIQKKYGLLQNIYRVRLRKQTDEDIRQRRIIRKEEKIKEKRSEEMQKETLMRRSSVDNCLLISNKQASLRNTISFKGLNKIYNDELCKKIKQQNQETKKQQERKQLASKLNQQYTDEYKVKIREQQAKKKRNIDKIKRLNKSQNRRKTSIQNHELSNLKLDNLIKRAHSVSLIELETEIKKAPAASLAEKRRSASLLSTKTKLNRKRNLDKKKNIKDNKYNQQASNILKLNNKQLEDIQNTIRIIQKLQAQHHKS